MEISFAACCEVYALGNLWFLFFPCFRFLVPCAETCAQRTSALRITYYSSVQNGTVYVGRTWKITFQRWYASHFFYVRPMDYYCVKTLPPRVDMRYEGHGLTTKRKNSHCLVKMEKSRNLKQIVCRMLRCVIVICIEPSHCKAPSKIVLTDAAKRDVQGDAFQFSIARAISLMIWMCPQPKLVYSRIALSGHIGQDDTSLLRTPNLSPKLKISIQLNLCNLDTSKSRTAFVFQVCHS
jgi:hypothetical protein